LAFLLYHSSCCALAGDDTDVPGFVQDDSIREEIGTLPGDEAYLLERTKELRAELKAKFKELTERLYAQVLIVTFSDFPLTIRECELFSFHRCECLTFVKHSYQFRV